ncbi:hypothetical protein RZO27_10150 [Lactococcus lactis]|uniref:Phage protein n=1 Tax=Lactococcus lactis TaxID=1358 RepID=A0ABD5GQI6_9LACT|nr:hypothetical protein [Lactococcus lactis]MDV2619478.1 hypothetical protein [Lactococcus lactis]
MSELEKTAQQIAAEALNFKSKAYYTIEQQNETIAANRKAFMKILSISSLTIPKSIADELDKVPFHNPITQLSNEDCDLTEFNDTVKRYAWNNKENGYICIAYITGKALGVDLVKVVEGIDDNY